jgi:hypothetical protein
MPAKAVPARTSIIPLQITTSRAEPRTTQSAAKIRMPNPSGKTQQNFTTRISVDFDGGPQFGASTDPA